MYVSQLGKGIANIELSWLSPPTGQKISSITSVLTAGPVEVELIVVVLDDELEVVIELIELLELLEEL